MAPSQYSVEFPGVPLGSDHHLQVPVEGEEFADENIASAVIAAKANIYHNFLQDVPGIFCNNRILDLSLEILALTVMTMTTMEISTVTKS